jgi:hypothetical protein
MDYYNNKHALSLLLKGSWPVQDLAFGQRLTGEREINGL